ncbi:hypothetical protein V3C99_007908 [Haemonchus contortus]
MRKTTQQTAVGVPYLNDERLTDLDFADDIALMAGDKDGLQKITDALNEEASMITPVRGKPCQSVKLARRRLQSVWSLSSISRNIKIRLYSSIVIPTAIYASETWKYMAMLNFNQKDGYFPPEMSAKDHEDTAHGSRHDKEVLRRSGMNSLHVIVARRRLRLAGHVLRMSQQRIPKMVMYWTPKGAKRGRGRPRNTWRRTFDNDLKVVSVSRALHKTGNNGKISSLDMPNGMGGTKSKSSVVQWKQYFRDVCAEHYRRNPPVIGGFGCTVEIDETPVARRKYNHGRWVRRLQWLFGGIERGSGRAFLRLVQRRGAPTMLRLIGKYLRPGTTIISECWRTYIGQSDRRTAQCSPAPPGQSPVGFCRPTNWCPYSKRRVAVAEI